MNKNGKKLQSYTVTFEGLTPNQAQAVEGIIASITDFKLKDEMPMNKLKVENEKFELDLILYKDISVAFENIPFKTNLGDRVQKRIDTLSNEIHKRETQIKSHLENIEYIENYVKLLRSKIKEEIDHDKNLVTYKYDTSYFAPFLDLGMIIFEMSFEENKKEMVN